MKIISVINSKGGVGKTTSSANIGACLSMQNYKVLLVDLDHQSNLTQSFNIESEKTIYGLLKEEYDLDTIIISPNLHIIPSEKKLAELEVELAAKMAREFFLRKKLQDFKGEYDFIIIDCSPSVGLLTVNALSACNHVLIPLQAQYLAMEGVKSLTETLAEVKNNLNEELEVLGVIITMYNRRRVLNREVATEIEKHYPIFETFIRENIALAEAPAAGKDIFTYSPTSHGAKDYENLTFELLKELS